jgi:hypothetical protein
MGGEKMQAAIELRGMIGRILTNKGDSGAESGRGSAYLWTPSARDGKVTAAPVTEATELPLPRHQIRRH